MSRRSWRCCVAGASDLGGVSGHAADRAASLCGAADAAFDALFARRTGYWHLDERIAKTAAKKAASLCVLDHPDVPLPNNRAELGARQRVRKRDVSLGPRSRAGVTAWDIFGTLTQTAAKLGVNVAHYLHDRLSGAYRMPPLAALITQRATEARSAGALAAA